MEENKPGDAPEGAPAPNIEAVTREVVESLLGVPSLYVNRFYITVVGPLVRLTFSEQIGGADGPMAVRSSVLLTVDDLLELRASIEGLSAHFMTVTVGGEEASA
jgi:hypothetical protein